MRAQGKNKLFDEGGGLDGEEVRAELFLLHL